MSETIPSFDGARLDDIVDYLTYAFAPMVLLWTGGSSRRPAGAILAALPLLASSYQFCRTDAKTDDHFFLGFPSYWNVVAFYVFVLELSARPRPASSWLACAVLVFVPIRYVYPSRTKTFRQPQPRLRRLWLVPYAVCSVQIPDPSLFVVALSLAYLAYYAGGERLPDDDHPAQACKTGRLSGGRLRDRPGQGRSCP